jgi:hypothetical protein
MSNAVFFFSLQVDYASNTNVILDTHGFLIVVTASYFLTYFYDDLL